VRTDGAEKSRLDLVVADAEHAAMLDLVVFYPLQDCGLRQYTHRSHESVKYKRYRPTLDGRRQHTKPLIPVVVSVFGVVNKTAGEYLAQVEASARARGRPVVPDICGPRSLGELVSQTAI